MNNHKFNCVAIKRDSPSIGVSTGQQTFDCRILIQEYINNEGKLVRSEQHIDNLGCIIKNILQLWA